MTELKMLVTIVCATVCFNDIAQIPPEMWKVITTTVIIKHTLKN